MHTRGMETLKSFVENYSLAPQIVDHGKVPPGLILEATTTRQLAVVESFMRYWFHETSYGFGVQITYPGRKYFLILHPEKHRGSKSVAIGAMEISGYQSDEPILEWIWLHPLFRKGTAKGSVGEGYAAPALKILLNIFPSLEVHLSKTLGPARHRMRDLWRRVHATPDTDTQS